MKLPPFTLQQQLAADHMHRVLASAERWLEVRKAFDDSIFKLAGIPVRGRRQHKEFRDELFRSWLHMDGARRAALASALGVK